ncbi:DUF421 domain-containing protein [Evansella cellulosilytica]|uniref:YetF C-terminal domain-containing protein n=1 Tax=Evansella cellulosilytica (strain ATCC 21833 / DSM 2522 / FERM P-1141 / JCM 9156 / N-4) TaxID=649639 RepID=E6U1P2_EVAC2|nr:DUF421 domain-containing protein [Evansella cellulosilytica]ADU30405.1 protein of unknown function DUF421 [Evansella cellulosilytica DSM 2522]
MFDFWTGAEGLPVYGFIIRACIVYIYVFVLIKVLGQRSMSTLNPIDFLFGVIIGDVIGEPLADGEVPLGGPLAAAAFIGGIHLFLSYISLKMPRYRRIIEDEPILLIEKGHILHEELQKAKVTVDSLLMDLRFNNAIDLMEVDYAILESNGQISVIKKSKYDSLTPNDMGQSPVSKGYPSVIIEDGLIIEANLKKFHDRAWLHRTLKQHGYNDATEVFLMMLDNAGNVYISGKNESQTV